MKKTAIKLIELNSKVWLADKLGISRMTLDTRLEKDNWKKSEIALLIALNRSFILS